MKLITFVILVPDCTGFMYLSASFEEHVFVGDLEDCRLVKMKQVPNILGVMTKKPASDQFVENKFNLWSFFGNRINLLDDIGESCPRTLATFNTSCSRGGSLSIREVMNPSMVVGES